jgi:hypothetical protein
LLIVFRHYSFETIQDSLHTSMVVCFCCSTPTIGKKQMFLTRGTLLSSYFAVSYIVHPNDSTCGRSAVCNAKTKDAQTVCTDMSLSLLKTNKFPRCSRRKVTSN